MQLSSLRSPGVGSTRRVYTKSPNVCQREMFLLCRSIMAACYSNTAKERSLLVSSCILTKASRMALPTFRAYVVHQGGLINLKQNGSAGLALWAEIWFTSRLEERDAGEY